MRVAFIGIKGLPAKGGAERVVEALVTRITSNGVVPVIYADARYSPADFSIEGTEIIRISSIPGKHFRTLSLVLFSAVHALLFGKYDFVHLHNIEVSFILPLLRLKFKVISTAHGFAYSRSKWGSIAKKLMRTTDYLFVKCSNIVSSVSAKDARELQNRFRREILYISNGVGTEFNPDFNNAEKVLNKHGLKPDEYLIFVAGRIEPTKGVHLAIEAVNRLENDTPLLVVGDENQLKSYAEEIHEMAGPNIYFQGLIKNPSVLFGLMKYARCLIFPSLVEAMSMVLLEAASLGIPVVCSDIEENREVLGEDGIYFESDNVNSLYKKLEWNLSHPDQMRNNADILQKKTHEKYSWDAIANQYLKVYQEVLAS